MQEIERIRSMVPQDFYGLNFQPVTYQDAKNETRPAYLLTRDAFTLLAMGFSGKAAIMWKLKYIHAFNTLEQQVLCKSIATAQQTTASLVLALSPLAKKRMLQVVSYRKRGFTYTEIAKVMNVHSRTVSKLLKTARNLGTEV